jgi:hypothetical protein
MGVVKETKADIRLTTFLIIYGSLIYHNFTKDLNMYRTVTGAVTVPPISDGEECQSF